MTRFLGGLIAILLTQVSVGAQDISLIGGGGFAAGEDSRTRAVSAIGVSAGAPFLSTHRVQFDYLFQGPAEHRHFVTGSYVLQGKSGRSRPYFQVGAGVVSAEQDTSLAVVFGAGVTIDLWKSLFVRPQVRLYGHVGPTLTILPGVAFGWRF